MTNIRMLAVFCAFEALLTTIASAQDPHPKIVPGQDGRRTPSPIISSKNHYTFNLAWLKQLPSGVAVP